MIDIDKLLRGSIDMHLHHGPDVMPRRIDALEAARQAQLAGMRAIVLKHCYYPTAPIVIIVNQLIPDVEVIGIICLDFEIGSLNPHALEKSAKLGAHVVCMPTVSSANSRVKLRALSLNLDGEGFSVLDKRGQLVPEIGHILTLVKEYDMVLASGNLSPVETFALINDTLRIGIWKLVITHPSDVGFVDQAFSLEDQRRLIQMGAFIEHTFVTLLPIEFGHNPEHREEAIKAIGAEYCIMSNDLGQVKAPSRLTV